MQRFVAALLLIAAGCGSTADTPGVALPQPDPPVDVVEPTTPPTELGRPSSPTTPTTAGLPSSTASNAVFDLGQASMTCAQLEGNVPDGVDDFGLDLHRGLLTFHWGNAKSASVQFLGDPSCTLDSDAWKYLIGHGLQVDLLYRSGLLCDFWDDLSYSGEVLDNRETIRAAMKEAEDLCVNLSRAMLGRPCR